jgi:hypothetical protein
MDFEIDHQSDGTFICSTKMGRKVTGMYHPDHYKRAKRLALYGMVTDPSGQPKAVIKEYSVTGYVSKDELCELVEALGQRCEDIECSGD